jgi:hypothetical protein
MTSDEFSSEYKLLKQIAANGGRSYTAEHLPSKRAVLVHILEENQVGGAAGLTELLGRLSPKDKTRILGTMKVEGSWVVVTQFLQGFQGFEAWVQTRSSAPTPTASSAPPPEMHGEFTRLFRSSSDAPASTADLSPVRDAPSPPQASGFTDLFRAPAPPPAHGQDPDRATIPPIRMVGVRVPPPSQSVPQEPEPPRLKPNFGPSPVSSPAPAQPEVVIRTGDPPPPSPPSSWDGPSEFTRLLGKVSLTGEVAQVSGQPEALDDPVAAKPSYLPLFVVLNLVFILATGLIVYFALQRC